MGSVLDRIRVEASIPYRIKPNGRDFAVWFHRGQGCWILTARFASREIAEDYLLTKLPKIEG